MLLHVETNLNISHNDLCEAWKWYGWASPDKRCLDPAQYEGIEDRRTGPASTPRVQTWPESLTRAPVKYREPKPYPLPRLVDIPYVAQPYAPQIQRFEDGKRVDHWSNDLRDYIAFNPDGSIKLNSKGKRCPRKPSISYRFMGNIFHDPWRPEYKPKPATRKNGGLIRYWTGMVYKMRLPEKWSRVTIQTLDGRKKSLRVKLPLKLHSTVGKPAEPREAADWSAWLRVGPEIKVKGWKPPKYQSNENRIDEERSPFLPLACAWYPLRSLMGAAGGEKEWIILSKRIAYDKMRYWPKKITGRQMVDNVMSIWSGNGWERDCNCGGRHLPTSTHCGFPPRFFVNISKEVIDGHRSATEVINLGPAGAATYRDRHGNAAMMSARWYGEYAPSAQFIDPFDYASEDEIPILYHVHQADALMGDYDEEAPIRHWEYAEGEKEEMAPFSTPKSWIEGREWRATLLHERIRRAVEDVIYPLAEQDLDAWYSFCTDDVLAFSYGKARKTIKNWRKGIRETLRSHGYTNAEIKLISTYERDELIIFALERGLSRKEIAETSGVTVETLDAWIGAIERRVDSF